jgi:serine/threonine protein kinase
MAPEQCRREPATTSMDMFALGALLHEAATGSPAFDSEEDVFVQLDERAQPVTDLAHDLPAPMAAVIDSLLDPDPGRRPDAAEVLNRLGRALPAGTPRLWPPFVDGTA